VHSGEQNKDEPVERIAQWTSFKINNHAKNTSGVCQITVWLDETKWFSTQI